jgi:hypothetical protein
MELNTYIWTDDSNYYGNNVRYSSIAYDVESARNKLIKLFTGISDKLIIEHELIKKKNNCHDNKERTEIEKQIEKNIKTLNTYNLLSTQGELITMVPYYPYKTLTENENIEQIIYFEKYIIELFNNEPNEILYGCSTSVVYN